MSSEWVDWHKGYASDTNQARRLRFVQDLLRQALDRAPPGPVRVVSLCAGDGRDILGVLEDHSRRADVRALLVESDPDLVRIGREQARALGLAPEQLEYLEADASRTDALKGKVPAQIVLVCGIFGNVTDEDVRNTIHHLPELLAPGGCALWTRGRFEPDLTPAIRQWLGEEGFDELAFVQVPDSLATVGSGWLRAPPRPWRAGVRLFTFLPRSERPSARK